MFHARSARSPMTTVPLRRTGPIMRLTWALSLDKLTPEGRSRNMRAIGQKDTNPELVAGGFFTRSDRGEIQWASIRKIRRAARSWGRWASAPARSPRPPCSRTARAAGRAIKIGMVSPPDRPDRRVRRGRSVGAGRGAQGARATASRSPASSTRSRSSIATASRTRTAPRKSRRSSSTTTRSTSWSPRRPETPTNPVADQCELAGVPCITADDPWEDWFFGRKGNPAKGFEWTYHFFWGFGMVGNLFADMWLSLPTNKIVGTDVHQRSATAIAANDEQHGMPPALPKSKGFNVVNLGLYPPLSDDFTAQITAAQESQLRDLLRHLQPAAIRDLLDPMRAAGLPPQDHDAAQGDAVPLGGRGAGNRGAGTSTEVWWSQHHPFKSGLTGQTRAAILRRLHRGDRQAVDPADRLQACQPRSRDRRRSSAPRSSTPPRSATRSPTTDYQSLVGPLTWKGGPTNPVQERVHDAAGRRPVEAGQEVQIRSAHRLQQDGAEHPARQPVRGDQVLIASMAVLLELDGVVEILRRAQGGRRPHPRGRGG